MSLTGWIGSTLLLLAVAGAGGGLALWKASSLQAAEEAARHQPEPVEVVTAAIAEPREHRRVTTAIGTVLALRSITLRNELAGTVRKVALTPGEIVEAGTVLVALDVSVEEAELAAQQAQALFSQTEHGRVQHLYESKRAASIEMERARAERDIAAANVERIRAIIERKTIRAPFRARVGMADVHPGQYLEEGTELTTLQGVDDAVHVDFTVTQQVAAALQAGDRVDVLTPGNNNAIGATIVALDARIDPNTRNSWVRARIEGNEGAPTPGASVRVRVPVGALRPAVAVPVSALRKGPDGDHLFVIKPDQSGQTRAELRAVSAGAMLGDEMLIVAGLEPGEQVAASGSFKLRDGVLVSVAPSGGPAEQTARK